MWDSRDSKICASILGPSGPGQRVPQQTEVRRETVTEEKPPRSRRIFGQSPPLRRTSPPRRILGPSGSRPVTGHGAHGTCWSQRSPKTPVMAPMEPPRARRIFGPSGAPKPRSWRPWNLLGPSGAPRPPQHAVLRTIVPSAATPQGREGPEQVPGEVDGVPSSSAQCPQGGACEPRPPGLWTWGVRLCHVGSAGVACEPTSH